MTINNLDMIHYLTDENHYLCNGACFITKSKSTRDIKKISCKNCLREIEKIIICKNCGFHLTTHALIEEIKKTGLCIKCFRNSEEDSNEI